MAAIGNGNLTLIDWAKRLDPDGKVATIVEILSETNEIVSDMAVMEGNLPTGHRTTIRSGLPAVAWRKLNYGVQPSKSRSVQVTDTAGMLEAYSQVDKSLAELNGNTPEFRMSEDRPFLEAMSQEAAGTLFYGDTSTAQEEFLGLAPRYSVKTGVELGDNIILGGGSGSDNTSVWLVVWGDNTCHSFFPKGGKAGLQFEDLGQETLIDAAGGLFEGYRSHYKWDIGMSLRDWRYVVRIPNIAIGSLTKTGSTGADLIDLMVQALELPPNMNAGRVVFYCNRTIKSFLRRQIANKSNVWLTMEQVGGKPVMMFGGVPVNRCDAIVNNEALVA